MSSLFLAIALVVTPIAQVAGKECTVEQYETDRKRMTAAAKAGHLHPDPESGRDGITLSVFIADSFWEGMTYIEKYDFAEALVCGTAGVGKGILVLNLRSEMTGEVIGEWRLNRLVPRAAKPPPTPDWSARAVKPRPAVDSPSICWTGGSSDNGCGGPICYCCYDEGCWICNKDTYDCVWDSSYRGDKRPNTTGIAPLPPASIKPPWSKSPKGGVGSKRRTGDVVSP